MSEKKERTFTIYGKYYEKLLNFEKEHKKSCLDKYADSFGSLFAYTFVPSGLGDIVSVQCECGEKLFISDLDF